MRNSNPAIGMWPAPPSGSGPSKHQIAAAEADDRNCTVTIFLYSRNCGYTGARPNPPATNMTVHPLCGCGSASRAGRNPRWHRLPSGTSFQMWSCPSPESLLLPWQAWKSATVSGIRSPCSSIRAMMKGAVAGRPSHIRRLHIPDEGGRSELLPANDMKHCFRLSKQNRV
jgi:hypothetical protein